MTSPNIEVREVRAPDLAAIVRMANELAAAVADPPSSVTAESLRSVLLGDPWCDCLVATLDDEPIGYALTSREFEAHTGIRRLRITDLFVTESARRFGIGATLFASIVEGARALNCQEVTWEVWSENAAAFAFYESLGARRKGNICVMRFAL